MITAWLGRLLVALVRRVGISSLLSLILLGVIFGSIATGMAGMIQDIDTSSFWLIIVGGVLVGWLLAKLPVSGWLAWPLMLLIGVGALIIRVGRLESAFLVFVRTYLRLSGDTWWVVKITPHHLKNVDTYPLIQAIQPLIDGFNGLFLRSRIWLQAFATGEGTFDPIAAALVWGFCLWIFTVWATWFVRRGDLVFLGIFPAGGVFAFMLYYTGVRTSLPSLVVMTGATLLLYALRNYVVKERNWMSANLDMVHSPWELSFTVVSLTAVLLLTASMMPSLSVHQMVEIFDALVTKRVGNTSGIAESLGLEARPKPVTAFDQARKAALPSLRLVGYSAKLSKQPVMYVSVAGFEPIPVAVAAAAYPKMPPRYYWRSFTYDQYNGRGWYTTPINVVDYAPGTWGFMSVDDNRMVVRQSVQPLVDMGGFIYVTGELVSVDSAFQVAWRDEGDALAAQSTALKYTADSLIPTANEGNLRTAGTDYPDWVRQHYLRLPEEMPSRVRTLAFDLTAVQPTPFDQVLAIETYLRTFTYTVVVPTPPLGRDVADYFLFDLKQGYCDYFATAMVVLARSVGIPARLVAGYASGSYDIFNGHFVVLEEDAHSWVEVYFPSYGWVEFEPTSSRSAIDHTGQNLGSPPVYKPSSGFTAVENEGQGRWRIDLWFLGFILLLIASVGWIGWWGWESWRVWRMAPKALVAYVYRRLYHQGRLFGLRSQPCQTPREFSEKFRLRVATFFLSTRPMKASARLRREDLLSFIARDINNLTLLYEQSLFSSVPLGPQEKIKALETWRSLHGHLRHAWWSAGGWAWLKK